MGIGKKIAVGILSFVPLAFLGLAAYGLAQDDEGLLYIGLFVSGIVDTGLAPIFIPHVHDNPRVGKDWKILWIALLGLPYITVAPLYWLIYIVPEKQRAPVPTAAELEAPGTPTPGARRLSAGGTGSAGPIGSPARRAEADRALPSSGGGRGGPVGARLRVVRDPHQLPAHVAGVPLRGRRAGHHVPRGDRLVRHPRGRAALAVAVGRRDPVVALEQV